jgi:hypothetical protein
MMKKPINAIDQIKPSDYRTRFEKSTFNRDMGYE